MALSSFIERAAPVKKLIETVKDYLGRNKPQLETATSEDLRNYSRKASARGMRILYAQGVGIGIYGIGTVMMLTGAAALTLPVMTAGLVVWAGCLGLNAINRSEQKRIWQAERAQLTARLGDKLSTVGKPALADAALSGFDAAAKPAAPAANSAKPQAPKPPQP